MNIEINKYSDQIYKAQELFDGALDLADRSRFITPDTLTTDNITSLYSPTRISSLFEVTLAPIQLKGHHAALIGKIMLVPNTLRQELSPGVIMPHGEDFELTMLDVAYDTKVGLTDGYKFAISAQAQTRTAGFGEHGIAGPLESGHFGTLLVGARSEKIGSKIIDSGDAATHGVINKGVAPAMQSVDMLPVAYRSRILPASETRKLKLYWHQGLGTENGLESADYPNAVRLMLGAGVAALGMNGLDRARKLVDYARQGMES